MLSMFREVVFGVGFALLLPRFFGLDLSLIHICSRLRLWHWLLP